MCIRDRCVAVCTVGQLLETLPVRQPVMGVTTMEDKVYVLRKKKEDEIEVYDSSSYELERFISVSNASQLCPVDVIC